MALSSVSVETAAAIANLQANVRRVRESIAAAASAAGRDPGDITLLAVSKRKPAEIVRAALECGLTRFGENYVREGVEKKDAVDGQVDLEWHLIGHLQSNKARVAIEAFDIIQSLDSEKLAGVLSRVAIEIGITQRVLIQVHLGDESTKTGIAPEAAIDLASTIASMPGLSLEGLMGIAPFGVDPRPHFRRLRALYEQLPPANRKILSMGMSSDYPIAIDEGSTMVRIGSDLFGTRI